MTLVKNGHPCSDWKWRRIFIKLSDRIGQSQNPSIVEVNYIKECEDHLTLKCKRNHYPLKHKVGKKTYLFYIKDAFTTICFKTYEGEPYLDKYGKWHNYDKNIKS
jgi:hypothetical protein